MLLLWPEKCQRGVFWGFRSKIGMHCCAGTNLEPPDPQSKAKACNSMNNYAKVFKGLQIFSKLCYAKVAKIELRVHNQFAKSSKQGTKKCTLISTKVHKVFTKKPIVFVNYQNTHTKQQNEVNNAM